MPRVLAGDCSSHSYSYDLVWAVNSAYSPIVHEVREMDTKYIRDGTYLYWL